MFYISFNERILLFIMGEIDNCYRILPGRTIERNFLFCSEHEDERQSRPVARSRGRDAGGSHRRWEPNGDRALPFRSGRGGRASEQLQEGASPYLAPGGLESLSVSSWRLEGKSLGLD